MHDITLKYFHAVAKTGSLSAASDELHVAVSAISRQITQLEEQLQVSLFERKPRGMALTPAGDILYTYSLRSALELSNVVTEMKGLNSVQQQTITLACPEGLAWDFVPYVTALFHQQHPQVIFSLRVVDSGKASQLVKEGVADSALTFSLQPEQGLEVALQVPSPVCALLSARHPLALRNQLSVHDLTGFPLAFSDSGTTLNYLFELACHIEGVKIVPAMTTNAMGAIYTYTKENPHAIALCSDMAVKRRAQHDGLVLLPMREPSLTQRSIQLQVMSHRKQPALVTQFIEFLTRMLQQQSTAHG